MLLKTDNVFKLDIENSWWANKRCTLFTWNIIGYFGTSSLLKYSESFLKWTKEEPRGKEANADTQGIKAGI